MIYIGIDPGKTGALAVIDRNQAILFPFSEGEYVNVLKTLPPQISRACLEHVTAMPKQGVTSMFNFGQNFGYIKGLLEAFSIPYELVRPQKWKREFSITGDKNSSIEATAKKQSCKRGFLWTNLNL